MVGWHHRLNGHEFEQTLGDGERHGSLAFAVHKESEMNEQLNNSKYISERNKDTILPKLSRKVFIEIITAPS